MVTAERDLPGVFSQLQGLVSDNGSQQESLASLGKFTDTKLQELKATIAIRGSEGFEPARAKVVRNAGKQTMDGIRSIVSEMQDRERQLLGERLTNARRAEPMMLLIAAVCIVLSIAGRAIAMMIATETART